MASSVQGWAPWRITNVSSGKSYMTSSMSSTCWGLNGTRGPGMPTHTKIGRSSSTHMA